jgi:CRP-like cAMP-binding protein
LNVLNLESNAKVFSRGTKCSDIIIIASGEIEIYVEANGESISLDVIGKGSVIG